MKLKVLAISEANIALQISQSLHKMLYANNKGDSTAERVKVVSCLDSNGNIKYHPYDIGSSGDGSHGDGSDGNPVYDLASPDPNHYDLASPGDREDDKAS